MPLAGFRPAIRPIVLGGMLVILAHVWLIGVALYAGARDPDISIRTVEIPYYALLFLGICLPLFQMKVWIYRWLVKALGRF